MLSIVVPAHNEETLLRSTLESISRSIAAASIDTEIVVVDDASTDATASIAAGMGARVVSIDRRQIAASRNAGARAAEGRFLLFVDADTLISPEAVSEALNALRRGAAGGGAPVAFEGRLPLYARLILPLMLRGYRTLGIAPGCFLFCTAPAFESAGGFDERYYGGEEARFSAALRRQGRFVTIRTPVVTSGRKLRTHSGWEVLGFIMRYALSSGRTVRRRESCGIWYDPRRADPG